MSIDLSWEKLDPILAASVVDMLNKQLSVTQRPSFIGPVAVTSLDFGNISPEIELLDMRDIHRDFLDGDDGSETEDESPDSDRTSGVEDGLDDEGFEWVSRRAVSQGLAQEAPAYHHLPPHVRYGQLPGGNLFQSTLQTSHTSRWQDGPSNRGPSSSEFTPSNAVLSSPDSSSHTSVDSPLPSQNLNSGEASDQSLNRQPNIQMHLRVTHHSDIRISLTTSLLINYPSPMFMSLPIKLSVTGLLFNGEVVIAYEGQRKRIHICILDDLDPYGPVGRNTPPEQQSHGTSYSSVKPTPVGNRLLPSIFIESEIGQADKHVLKNVSRVERFIQDVIRETLEEELVFPNFQTFVLP